MAKKMRPLPVFEKMKREQPEKYAELLETLPKLMRQAEEGLARQKAARAKKKRQKAAKRAKG